MRLVGMLGSILAALCAVASAEPEERPD